MNVTTVTIQGCHSQMRYTSTLFQYDYGQILKIEGVELPDTFQAHFCNVSDSSTITVLGSNNQVQIPDQFLNTGEDILCYIYLHTGEDDGETEYKIFIPVTARQSITNEEPTPEQQSEIDQLIIALNDGVSRAETAATNAETSEANAKDSEDNAKESELNAKASEDAVEASAVRAETAATSAEAFASSASQSAINASESATLSESWAVGGTGTRQGEDTNNAKYYAESTISAKDAAVLAKTQAESARDLAVQAKDSAQASAQTATTKASEATQSATSASQSASSASASSASASQSAALATSAKTAAETAQGLAEDARDDAVNAKDDAETAQQEAERAAQSISEEVVQIAINTQDISDLKSAFSNGSNIPVEKELNWINGYVHASTGKIINSSLSKTCLVPMKKGEIVTIGTANSNIAVISSTTADSIAVGDTVTPIKITTSSGAFETYSYKALTDINIVLCVRYSNYSIEFTGPTYYQKELDELSKKVFAESYSDLSNNEYSVIAGASSINSLSTRVDVNIVAGNGIKFSVDDPNGAITKYYLYLNGSSDYTDYLPNKEYSVYPSTDVTRVGVYVDSAWAVADGTITVNFTKVDTNSNSIEARVDAVYPLTDYVPSGVSDGYVLAHPTANGSFLANGSLTTGVTTRIRTALIPFKANEKIVIENGSFEHGVGMWQGTPSISTNTRNDNTYISTDETIEVDYDGYIVIVFRKPDQSNIEPSEFDGGIQLYNTLAYRLSAVVGVVSVPDYYLADDYLSNKASRINTIGKEGDDVFAFITDVHWEMNARHSPLLLSYLSENCALHKVFNGGDVANRTMLDVYKKFRKAIDGKSYHVTGNHDWFSPENGKTLYYTMDSANNDQIGDAFGHYYYVDNVQQKIRYIILNSFTRAEGSSTITPAYSSDEIAWFTNTALHLPSTEWDVIVFTHYLRTTSISITGGSDIENAIDAFNADSSHAGKILAVFQGHTHWDGVYHTAGGVPVITTTCDKWDLSNESELAQEQPGRVLGTISEQAFDVVVLNRTARTITAVRIGALAQNNVDIYRTDPNFEWIGTLEERVINY